VHPIDALAEPLLTMMVVVTALAVLARRLRSWRPVCGCPLPVQLRTDWRRMPRCRRRLFHAGDHAVGGPFTLDEQRWPSHVR